MPADRLGWSWSRGWAVFVALLLLSEAGLNAYFNAAEGEWLGMVLAATLPLAAAWTWWTQRKRGTEFAEVADRMVVYVMLALGLYSWVVWPW